MNLRILFVVAAYLILASFFSNKLDGGGKRQNLKPQKFLKEYLDSYQESFLAKRQIQTDEKDTKIESIEKDYEELTRSINSQLDKVFALLVVHEIFAVIETFLIVIEQEQRFPAKETRKNIVEAMKQPTVKVSNILGEPAS